jgi:hypothetical protein
MPGEPVPCHTGGAPHASDGPRRRGGDTPYDETHGLPMTKSQPRSNRRSVVVGPTYGEVDATKSEKD